ncbi:MAG: PilZ domain-containing protein [Planctomycetes bacterium]|nr:PilZ domain-containing protein [Planctomycetota bacterium]
MHASSEMNEERLALDLSRRKHFRLECSLEASYRYRNGDDEVVGQALVRNIGLGGARIDCDQELPMPCRMTLVLPAMAEEGVLEIPASVAWSVVDRGTGPYPTGIQILDQDEKAWSRLFRYIAALMR